MSTERRRLDEAVDVDVDADVDADVDVDLDVDVDAEVQGEKLVELDRDGELDVSELFEVIDIMDVDGVAGYGPEGDMADSFRGCTEDEVRRDIAIRVVRVQIEAVFRRGYK